MKNHFFAAKKACRRRLPRCEMSGLSFLSFFPRIPRNGMQRYFLAVFVFHGQIVYGGW